MLGSEVQGVLEKYHYGNGAKNHGFKKRRPERGMSTDKYEKELTRWESSFARLDAEELERN
ncbi:MAG: hypothetical protein ACM3TN_09130 [Alphaproteobacteria bacterium]